MEFKSKLEELSIAKELFFGATPGFGAYRKFLDHAVAHPAKMNTKLLEFLVKTFTNSGETVLDPMCGSGSTGVVCALLGRDAVCVDLEQKFIGWSEEAKRKVQESPSLIRKGSIVNICEDSRRLSELLKKTDAIMTSPPYSESQTEVDGEKGRRGGDAKKRVKRDYVSVSKNNIGSLKHGEIKVILTSPPFPQDVAPHTSIRPGQLQKPARGYTESKREKGNIGNLPLGKVNAIITSPPYEDTGHTHDFEFMKKISKEQGEKSRDVNKGHFKSEEASLRSWNTMEQGKLENPANIGKTKKETYLSAMLTIYVEMFKVLKADGVAAIVIKPFVRNKQVVDLPFQTWQLMERTGFKLIKVYKLRLKQESFWRILHRKKYPKVPKIAHEYILIARKVT